jgi:hypothetical protein
MKQMGICKRVKWLAMNQPLTLPSIINDKRYKREVFIGILNSLLPRRTSIEIECIGRLTNGLGIKDKGIERPKFVYTSRTFPELAKKYGILELNIDDRVNCEFDEHSFSIKNYTQLIGLYKVLRDMKKYSSLNEASGCHIHVDISDIMNMPNYNEGILKNYFTKIAKSETLNDLFGTYNGNMMEIRDCGDSKNSWICYRGGYHTLEFRTPPMTFDYSLIMKWFVGVNKLVNKYKNKLVLEEINNKKQKVVSEKESLNEKRIQEMRRTVQQLHEAIEARRRLRRAAIL